MSDTPATNPLREQLDYYRARAAEYDKWWLRLGRYDRGPDNNAQWFAEAAEVASALKEFRPSGRILDLACGTGIWAEQLLPFATHLTAVDGSPEMLALADNRLRSSKVTCIEANLFEWRPGAEFDTVFFGFWLSHVPAERFDAFWELVRGCVAPGGRVFFVDSRYDPTSTAVDHLLPEEEKTEIARRRLNDGREFQVYKVFYKREELTERLRQLRWRFEMRETERYFLYGWGKFE